MNRHSQKGSALLIVLGFLSFMVVSAVAFAIWMRNERLPSSALRRSVANRYLVKAALAQAMSRVDDAIRSHVFPGAWNTNQQNMVYRDPNQCAYDWWESRVFMPPDPEGVGTTLNTPESRYAPVTKTVSVLNLEALGYLPPAIANDVRLLARSSWAAQWDYFTFDAGRYAFCAVNVSDFLDITKLAADSPRTSAAAVQAQSPGEKPPPSRFSLAYLFRTSTNPNSDNFTGVNGLTDFDQFVHISPGQGEWTAAPLVSLMDYNLSIGEDGKAGLLWSPFSKLASGLNNSRFFYLSTGMNNPLVKGAERQPFVTASWFPPSDSTFAKSDGTSSTPLDLSQHQPFKTELLTKTGANIDDAIRDDGSWFWQTMNKNGHAFCVLDYATLLDYLDEDDVPLSLAMPCTERVPMITALAPGGNMGVAFTPLTSVGPGAQSGNVWVETSQAKIQITLQSMDLSTTLLFPFKDGKAPAGCTAQAFARLVFVAQQAAGGGGGGVAAGSSVSLRNNGFARNFRPVSDSEWTDPVGDSDQFKLTAGASQGFLTRTSANDCMLVTLPGVNASWTPPAKITEEKDCWRDMQLPLQMPAAQLEMPIIQKYDVFTLVPATPTAPASKGAPIGTYFQVLLNPFDANGNVIDLKAATSLPIPNAGGEQGMESTAFTAALATTLGASYTISPYLVTWARVMQDGKTVDMVPASYEDDKAFNGIDNNMVADVLPITPPLGNTDVVRPSQNSPAMPIMRFPGKLSFDFTVVMGGTAVPPNEWAVKSCYAVDPRFNWAPENWWFDSGDANPTGQKWYNAVFNDGGILDKLAADEIGGDGRADRANDPFLFVSNLGYLQSVGELAFLPKVSDMRENGMPNCFLGADKNGDYTSSTRPLYDGNPRDLTSVATMPCVLAAWKSYQNYRTNPKEGTFEFGANLYRRGLVNGSQGYYINPYTQSQEVMLAALANTPLNYWVAGTNYTAQGKSTTDFTTFNSFKNYMFSDGANGAARITGKDINKIATFLRHRFEDLASMIEIPVSMGESDRYVYQKVWEDMFDALDWGGVLDCTVEDVYNDLADYYDKGESNNKDYLAAYQNGGPNGYSDLNHFVRGGGKKAFGTSIRLHPDRALHKDEFNLKADPLRGQYAGDTGNTSCYDTLHDVDRKFLHSYWRDCFGNRQQLFLIFVRAESTALGGNGEGTPAQQGGRAVALVWRDPVAPDQTDVQEREDAMYQRIRHPHKMRVLFYRQFE